MAATSKTLVCVIVIAIGATGCVVSFNESLLVDGSPRTDSTVLDLGAVDLAGDHGANDQPTAPDSEVPDLPAVNCTSWSSWSCSVKRKNSVARCPKTGTQVYSLVCNTGGCACKNVLTSVGKSCSGSFGVTCADNQTAFAGGCCPGI